MAEARKEVVAALEAAVAAVEKAKVPKDLRVAAFNAAFYGRAANTSRMDSNMGSKSQPDASTGPVGDVAQGAELIAQKLEISAAQAAIFYDVDEDGVHLTVKRVALNAAKKLAQQEVTYLLVAGRQATGLEEWTTAKSVIEATHDRGVHDTNVSKAIGALDGDGLRFRGTGSKREIKMNAVGFSKASEIVKQLAGAS